MPKIKICLLFPVSSYITSTGTVIVKSSTYIPYIVTLFPQGKISDDYNVTIKVDIFDQKGSSYVEMLTVKVYRENISAYSLQGLSNFNK